MKTLRVRLSLLYIGLDVGRSNLSHCEQWQMSALHGFRWSVVSGTAVATVARSCSGLCWPPQASVQL